MGPSQSSEVTTIYDFGNNSGAGQDVIALAGYFTEFFIGTDFNDNQFGTVSTFAYSGGVDFTDATEGLVYASATGASVGRLYYDPDDTQSGDEVLLAEIVEYDGTVQLDNDLTTDDILSSEVLVGGGLPVN